MSGKDSVVSIQRSLDILNLEEKDQTVMEFVINGNWSSVRDSVTKYGSQGGLSQKLVSCICSVSPPQSVIIAIKRAQSRSFAQLDEKGRYPLHYLCYYGADTYSIVFAAQCHIAALEHPDSFRKTPLEYLMTMPWQFCAEGKWMLEAIITFSCMHVNVPLILNVTKKIRARSSKSCSNVII